MNYTLHNIKSSLEKLFRLPSPPASYDWDTMFEDEEKRQKELSARYPVRYFLAYTVFDRLLFPVERRVSNAYWWVRYHTTHRYHFLDLRQPETINHFKNHDHYAYGYSDVQQRMLYAMFNLLCHFVEKELPHVDVDAASLVDRPELQEQYNFCVEVKALYHYWKIDRHDLQREYDMVLYEWSKMHHSNNDEARDALWKEVDELEKKVNNTEDEMSMRLLKIRRHLWS